MQLNRSSNTEALPPARSEPQGSWVIFKDGARGFYVRHFYLGGSIILSTDEVIEGKNVDDVRARLPEGLINLGRGDNDEPDVMETWA